MGDDLFGAPDWLALADAEYVAACRAEDQCRHARALRAQCQDNIKAFVRCVSDAFRVASRLADRGDDRDSDAEVDVVQGPEVIAEGSASPAQGPVEDVQQAQEAWLSEALARAEESLGATAAAVRTLNQETAAAAEAAAETATLLRLHNLHRGRGRRSSYLSPEVFTVRGAARLLRATVRLNVEDMEAALSRDCLVLKKSMQAKCCVSDLFPKILRRDMVATALRNAQRAIQSPTK